MSGRKKAAIDDLATRAPSVDASEWLEVVVAKNHVKPDGKLSSAAFSMDKIDIHVASHPLFETRDASKVVVRIRASLAYSLNLKIIMGEPDLFKKGSGILTGSKTRAARRALAMATERAPGTRGAP